MTEIRTDWTREEIAALFDLPFTGLLRLLGHNMPPVGEELSETAQ